MTAFETVQSATETPPAAESETSPEDQEIVNTLKEAIQRGASKTEMLEILKKHFQAAEIGLKDAIVVQKVMTTGLSPNAPMAIRNLTKVDGSLHKFLERNFKRERASDATFKSVQTETVRDVI